MENNVYIQPAAPRRNTLKWIILVVASVILVAGIAVAVAYILRKQSDAPAYNLDGTLKQAAESMVASTAQGNGYPLSLPESFSAPDGISVNGGGSFDGTSYCITAIVNEDKTVKKHISSASEEVKDGSCQEATDLPKPGIPGLPSISVVGPTQIGVTWKLASNASKYELQCATDDQFKEVISVKTDKLSGMCAELKSGTQYFIRVKSQNSQSSDWSEVLIRNTSNLGSAS